MGDTAKRSRASTPSPAHLQHTTFAPSFALQCSTLTVVYFLFLALLTPLTRNNRSVVLLVTTTGELSFGFAICGNMIESFEVITSFIWNDTSRQLMRRDYRITATVLRRVSLTRDVAPVAVESRVLVSGKTAVALQDTLVSGGCMSCKYVQNKLDLIIMYRLKNAHSLQEGSHPTFRIHEIPLEGDFECNVQGWDCSNQRSSFPN